MVGNGWAWWSLAGGLCQQLNTNNRHQGTNLTRQPDRPSPALDHQAVAMVQLLHQVEVIDFNEDFAEVIGSGAPFLLGSTVAASRWSFEDMAETANGNQHERIQTA